MLLTARWILILGLTFTGMITAQGVYRDKHGNQGTIILGLPTVELGGSGIDYTVTYTLTDSEGNKSGEYNITSDMLLGRDPGSDDFVLSVNATALNFTYYDDTHTALTSPVNLSQIRVIGVSLTLEDSGNSSGPVTYHTEVRPQNIPHVEKLFS